ncbi:WYL domain-containing protein [Frankia casuarinae]|uniref:WYL domain-containing protein n=1 Tax=Frankia casuarinae (strain DSM 45818 / CECT 9043 / HFP020203 / CcI3) TaxID=106370 RepID=UPI00068538E9|nr:WYL domain-containing protein [Frankia casuarinae]
MTAWLMLEHAPTSREIRGDKELAPPLPLASAAGGLRRAMLCAARGGLSLRVAGEHVDWFFPLHLYGPGELRDKAAAAIRELEYLVKDVARLHGKIRVRGMRSCVMAEEALISEILHTRSLAKLSLARVAPTVLSSSHEPHEVLARLRAAGLSPVAEDATGTVIVEKQQEHRAAAPRSPTRAASRVRPRMDAEKLAARLLADPDGTDSGGSDISETSARLAQLNPGLTDTEIILLADAIEAQRDVLISYRNKAGNRTAREIQPHQLYGRWLEAWCHLRDAQRDFTVANIESVAPVG